MVYLLLNAGLNPRQKDSYGQVRGMSTYIYCDECIQLMSVSTVYCLPIQTPLHSTSIKGDVQCAEMLIEHVSQ